MSRVLYYPYLFLASLSRNGLTGERYHALSTI